MIQLPTNWRETIRVLRDTHLLLAYANANREYFLFTKQIDRAIPLDDQIEYMGRESVAVAVQRISADGTTDWLPVPTNQDWLPMPVPDVAVMSLAQYRAHHRLLAEEVKQEAQGGGNQ